MNGSSPRSGFEIEIRANGILEQTINISPDLTAAQLTNLLPLMSYNIMTFVVSDVGRSRQSSINGTTLSLSMLFVKQKVLLLKSNIFFMIYSISRS